MDTKRTKNRCAAKDIMKLKYFAVVLSVLLSFAMPASLFGADPNLSVIVPRGVQRGTEQTLRFAGARLDDAQEILFYEPGFEVLEIKAADANNNDVKIRIAADCVG